MQNTDAVHLALKLNDSVLLGRKIRVKRCGDKWKAPQKSPNQSRAPKDRIDATLKSKRCPNDSFVGEKATPLKKSTKPKRLKNTPRNKAGKNKQSFDKKKTYKSDKDWFIWECSVINSGRSRSCCSSRGFRLLPKAAGGVCPHPNPYPDDGVWFCFVCLAFC